MASPIFLDDGKDNIQLEIFNIITRFDNPLLNNISNINADEIEEEGSTIKLNIHANSAVVGRHAHIIHCTRKQISVSGFTNRLVDL